MRHKKKFNHLSRKEGHRKSMLANMASSLIKHKKIETTLAKAKALRVFIEPLVTRSKKIIDPSQILLGTKTIRSKGGVVEKVEVNKFSATATHDTRIIFSYLRDKEAVKELIEEIAPKVGDRPGGYVRVLKTGFRKSDSAEMALIEFVDFNEEALEGTDKKAKKTTRRSRRGGSGNKAAETVAVSEKSTKAKAPKKEAVKKETSKKEVKETPKKEAVKKEKTPVSSKAKDTEAPEA